MSTLVVDRQLSEESAELPQSPHRRVAAPVRAPRRGGQLRGPNARPLRAVPAPSLGLSSTARAQACLVTPTSSTPDWRLTERGVALVLVVALMLAVAALTVVGLTAVRVTSPRYEVSSIHPGSTAVAVGGIDRAGLGS